MRVCVYSSFIAAILPLLLCLLSGVTATIRHRQQRHQYGSAVSSSTESKTTDASSTAPHHHASLKMMKTISKDQSRSLVMGATSSPSKRSNLFEEYTSREMYTCSKKLIGTLGKLNALIKEAYKEHHDCQQQLQSAIRTNHQKASLQEANDLLAKWEEDGYEYEDDDEDSGSFETNELGHISG